MKRCIYFLWAASLVIFGGLWAMITWWRSPIQAIDQNLRIIVNQGRTPAATAFFTRFTQLFDARQTIIWCLAVIIISWLAVNKRLALQTAIIVFGGNVLNRAVKVIVQRPRPAVNILMHYSSYSFPSGHSAASALILGSLILIVWQLHWPRWLQTCITALLVVTVFLIGFSRIYVGAHYPSDVLAGWCLGAFVLTSVQLIFQRFWPQSPHFTI